MARLAGLEIGGVSVGGIETCLDLPEIKVCFDLGRPHEWSVSRQLVLFTHAHMDHMGGIAGHCALRRLHRLPPPRYVVPRENAEDVRELFATWRKLDRSTLECEIVPLGPGDEFELPNRWIARPFRSPHRVHTQGYALWSRRRKLPEALSQLTPDEIQQRKRDGHDPTVVVETPEFAFTGDTLVEVVEHEEVVRKARVLAIEVTFLDDRVPVEEARAKGHIHLDEIVARADLFQNEAILMLHFSARHGEAEIERLLRERLPAHLRDRTTAFVSSLQTVDRRG